MAGGALRMASMDDLDLRMSERVRPLYDAVKAFIRDEVDPITEEFYRLGEGRAERWSWATGQLELLDGAKAKAHAQGLWNFFLPNAETGEGLSNLDYAYIANELGQEPARLGVPQLLGARHRQHGGARAGRHARAEEAVARAAAARRDPLGLRHDRARRDELGRQEHPDPGGARRRRVGDQRREVLHLRRRRPSLQDHDHDGADQPRRRHLQAAVADPRADRTRPASRSSARCTCSARTTRRTATCTCGSTTCACRRATCCWARAAASRSPRCASGRAASTTACARSAPPSGPSS